MLLLCIIAHYRTSLITLQSTLSSYPQYYNSPYYSIRYLNFISPCFLLYFSLPNLILLQLDSPHFQCFYLPHFICIYQTSINCIPTFQVFSCRIPYLIPFSLHLSLFSGCFDTTKNMKFLYSRTYWQPLLNLGLKEAFVSPPGTETPAKSVILCFYIVAGLTIALLT